MQDRRSGTIRNPWNLLLARHLANSYDIYSDRRNEHNQNILLSANGNRNLRKYIIDFILKLITNVFSNRATSEHWATLLKFIYIVWAAPKRCFVTTT